MDGNHAAACAIFGLAAAIAIYYASNNSSGKSVPVPHYESELQFAGMNVKAGLKLGNNSPGNITPELHFWAPGFPWADCDEEAQPVATRHRYPVVPGGNVSTVIHHGWSGLCDKMPANHGWFLNPPEVAVL